MLHLIHLTPWSTRILLFTVVVLSLACPPIVLADDSSSTKYVHFEYKGVTSYGVVEGDNVRPIKGNIFSEHTVANHHFPLNKLTLLPATYPSKIIAVGLNYSSHFNAYKGARPRLFAKLTSSLTAYNKPIWLYPNGGNLHYEGELVVVIGKQARNISITDAHNVIFGVTAGNDVTERSWQASDLQWLRGKGADSFSPVAPWISTHLNYNNLLVETRINGKTVQSERSKNLLFNVDEIVSYASQYFTLYPGDLIFTGTPGSTSAMKEGDIVEVEVEGVGIIRNKVTLRP